MLKPSFLKKWVVVEGSLSVTFPGSNIPSWFKEQQHGHQIALKVPPRWQTQIMGFAICGVFMQPAISARHSIEFRFENDGIFVPYMSEVDCIDVTTSANDGNVWLDYIYHLVSFSRCIMVMIFGMKIGLMSLKVVPNTPADSKTNTAQVQSMQRTATPPKMKLLLNKCLISCNRM